MRMISVDSSDLSAVGYDPVSKILRIIFHSGGVYDYFDVPESTYVGLMNATSKGQYHNIYIKWVYRYQRVG